MLRRQRVFVTGVLVNVLLLSSLVSFPTAVAACPDEPPKTLLQLFRSSDTIYSARFARTEKPQLLRTDGEYEVFNDRRRFDVSNTLKGEARKFFVLEQEDWVYKSSDPEAQPDAEVEGEFNEDELKIGDRVLLFLKSDEKNPRKLVLVDLADGVKKIDPEALGSYQKRIRELNGIFSAAKPDDNKIVEWLIRCAEDRHTRWEGAFEFLQAFEALEFQQEQEKAKAEASEDGEEAEAESSPTHKGDEEETAEAEEMSEEEAEGEEIFDNSVYAKLLTDSQKQRLSNILINDQIEANADPEAVAKKVEGDMELIDLVARWGDTPVATALLDQLRAGAATSWDASRMMTSIARVLRDDALTKISTDFSEIAWGEDDEEIPEAEPATEAERSAEPTDEVTEPARATAAVSSAANAATKVPETGRFTNAAEAPAASSNSTAPPFKPTLGKKAYPRPTFGKERSRLTAKFLARADELLNASKVAAATAK